MATGDRCPKCNATTTIEGEFPSMDGNRVDSFNPSGEKLWPLTTVRPPKFKGVPTACLLCGHTWVEVDPAELREYIRRRCNKATQVVLAPFTKQPSDDTLA